MFIEVTTYHSKSKMLINLQKVIRVQKYRDNHAWLFFEGKEDLQIFESYSEIWDKLFSQGKIII